MDVNVKTFLHLFLTEPAYFHSIFVTVVNISSRAAHQPVLNMTLFPIRRAARNCRRINKNANNNIKLMSIRLHTNQAITSEAHARSALLTDLHAICTIDDDCTAAIRASRAIVL